MNQTYLEIPVIKEISQAQETGWVNPKIKPWHEVKGQLNVTSKDIDDAEERLQRFAPFIRKCFPETEKDEGLIESVLTPIPEMKGCLEKMYGEQIPGQMLLKQDSHKNIPQRRDYAG